MTDSGGLQNTTIEDDVHLEKKRNGLSSLRAVLMC